MTSAENNVSESPNLKIFTSLQGSGLHYKKPSYGPVEAAVNLISTTTFHAVHFRFVLLRFLKSQNDCLTWLLPGPRTIPRHNKMGFLINGMVVRRAFNIVQHFHGLGNVTGKFITGHVNNQQNFDLTANLFMDTEIRNI